MDALWLLPTQKVTGVVELSTKTLRIFVERGRRYSVNSPLFVLRRSTRSVTMEPVQSIHHSAPGRGARRGCLIETDLAVLRVNSSDLAVRKVGEVGIVMGVGN